MGEKEKSIRKIPIEIEFTSGYEQRFTAAVIKIYANRKRMTTGEVQKQAAS
jgi:hypothetical protein